MSTDRRDASVFVALGLCTATFQTLLGYPLDTLKTRLQAMPLKPQVSSLCRRQLYHGWRGPFLVQLLLHPVFFSTYSFLRQEHELNPAMSGFMTGGLVALLTNPVEVRKTCVQTQQPVPTCMRVLCTRGLGFTIARETVGTGAYWQSFESLDVLPVWCRGGLAGVISWAVSYPLDVAKTRRQTSIAHDHRILPPERARLAFLVTMVRAFVVNAGILSIYQGFS